MNRVILSGNLTKEPDVRMTGNDLKFAKFTIAVNGYGNKSDKPDFINCVAFSKTAELIEKYVHKGSKLLVEGSWKTGSYETENGRKYTNECAVLRVEFLSKKDDFYDAPDFDTDFFD